MKKTYLLLVAVFAFIATGQAVVIPYLPTLQSFNGTSVDLATFVPTDGDYTLEVQGTIATEISVANGVYTYTPTTNAVVRFSQKNGKVYVYEANEYKTTLTPVVKSTFPEITDGDALTNPNNLLQNASFETLGTLVGGTNYNFGTPWTTSVTVAASGGIRIGTGASVNGAYVCIWRGSGNTNYFAQSVSTPIKANTAYKVIVRQVAGSNASADFNVGLGSTDSGLEYGYKALSLGSGKNGTISTIIRTSLNVSETSYFTFKNTSTNTSSSGNDPLTQMDYLALVEGVDVPGIVGVASATFLAGSAYAPENVADFSAGDYYDMTPLIVNPSFESVQLDKQQTIPSWTKTGPSDTEFCTRNDAGPLSGAFKTGNVYFQFWSNSKPDYSISQTITGLPNGKYSLTAAAGGSENTTGTFVFADDNQIQVTSTGGDYSVESVVINGSLTIGFKSISRSVAWSYADNFRLYYLGEVHDPILTLSASNLFFDPSNLQETFTVNGTNLTENATLTFPAGISLDKTSLTPAEVAAGATVTATFDNATAISTGSIIVTSGLLTKSITVIGSACTNLLTPTYNDKTNLINDPFCNNRSKFGGWGDVVVSNDKSYCGARSIQIFAGSLDVSIAGGIALASETYRVLAKLFVPTGNTAKFGLFGLGLSTSDVIIYNSISNDAWETVDFTFKTGTVGTGGVFLQRASGTDGIFVDNYEMYEVAEPTVRIKYVDALNENTSIKDDRVYTATWGATVADYLTIGKSYTVLATDKDDVTFNSSEYKYDATSVDNTTTIEGENVIVLKFTKVISGFENSKNNMTSVYPTVANGTVNVNLNGKSGSVKVFDTTGRLIISKQISNSIEAFKLSNAGMYLFEISTGNLKETIKVINMK